MNVDKPISMTSSASSKVLRNSTSHFIAAAINVGTSFVVMPIVVHGIGLTEFGIWAVAITLVGYMGLLDLGMSQTLIKKSSELLAKEDYTGLNGAVSSILALYLFICIALLVVLIPLIYWVPYAFNIPSVSVAAFREVFLILGVLAAVSLPMSILNGLIGGLQDFYVANIINVILNVAKAALTVGLINYGYGLIALVWLGVGISLTGWLAYFLWVKTRLPRLSIKFALVRGDRLKEIARFSASMFIWVTAGQAYLSADRVIGAILLPIGSVGIYEIGARLNAYSRNVLNVVFIAMPAASAIFATGEHARLRTLYLQGTKYTFAAYGGVVAATLMYGREFVELWMGSGFQESVFVAQVLLIASLFQSQNVVGHTVLVGMGRLGTFTRVMAAYPVAIIGLASVLGAYFGLIGIALGVALAVCMLEAILLIHLCGLMTTRLIDLLRSCQLPIIVYAAVAAIVSGEIMRGLGPNSWLNLGMKITLFGAIYGLLFVAFGLSRDERRRITGWFSSLRKGRA